MLHGEYELDEFSDFFNVNSCISFVVVVVVVAIANAAVTIVVAVTTAPWRPISLPCKINFFLCFLYKKIKL